jgi:hypothetical protein
MHVSCEFYASICAAIAYVTGMLSGRTIWKDK